MQIIFTHRQIHNGGQMFYRQKEVAIFAHANPWQCPFKSGKFWSLKVAINFEEFCNFRKHVGMDMDINLTVFLYCWVT